MYRKLKKLLMAALMTAATGDLYAEQFAYMVSFTDKNNTPYSLSSPEAYLSSRALTRRTTQSIAIDSTDIPVNTTYIDSVLTLTGGKLHGRSRWLNMCVILLEDSAQIHALDGKAWVRGTKYIAYFEGTLHRPAPKTGNTQTKLLSNKTTWAAAEYGTTWVQTALLKGNPLHDDGYTGNGRLIAVMDGGFTNADTHPGFDAMWDNGRMVDKHNFTYNSDFVFGYDGHGTLALSTMAGYVPGTYIGSAPNASYALYVTEHGPTEQPIELANMLFASERADSIGADVISTSLGYNLFDNPAFDFVFATDFDGKTTIGAQAANMATKKGILFVATAGNEGGGGWNKVLTPGDADSALTVGSVDYMGYSPTNSSHGPNAAGRVKPDVCGMGQGAAVFIGLGYGNSNGTSFSTPQIAGWAACLWQAFPGATPYQIRESIIRCASRYTAPTTQQGYGIPDFWCSEKMVLSVDNHVQRFERDSWVTVSPNPFGDKISLTIAADTDETVHVSLSDAMGRIIADYYDTLTRGYNTMNRNLPTLPSGVYFLKVASAGKQQTVKLLHE
jgi:hypothetical protein